MSKNKSLKYQVESELLGQLRIGQSRHDAKEAIRNINKQLPKGNNLNVAATDGIYSWETYHNYLKHCLAFADFAKSVYDCRTLSEAKQHVADYIDLQTDKSLSAWTIDLKINALAKLYKTPTKDFMQQLNIKAPKRLRADIKRSRTAPDNHYSEANHQDVADFGKGTGLRRRDLLQIKKKDYYIGEDDNAYIHVDCSKGGKPREVLVLPEYRDHIHNMIFRVTHPDDNVFSKNDIPCRLPEHMYRANYAKELYGKIARPLDSLDRKDKYICRSDKKGVVYDRSAMLTVSRNLGHNRIDVIAYSYL